MKLVPSVLYVVVELSAAGIVVLAMKGTLE